MIGPNLLIKVIKQTDIAIFDFSKAFDSVPHKRLLVKLENYGIHGNTLKWISAFLHHCTQRAILDGRQSAWLNIPSGVPRGMVATPLLFLLYINDITEGITSTIRLFADDCTLYRKINTVEDCLKRQPVIFQWSILWQVNFNS